MESKIEQLVVQCIKEKYQAEISSVEIQDTRKEFKGDLTVVVFPLLKIVKTNPAQLAQVIGEYIQNKYESIISFNVIKGFLNLEIAPSYYLEKFEANKNNASFGFAAKESKKAIMVEFASPNTNKPLHLGHIRNVLLGYSMAQILKAAGHRVYKTQIVNDRGIHICKSMLAWFKYGDGETPSSSGVKGDKLVGKYYVKFDEVYKSQIKKCMAEGMSKEEAAQKAPILIQAKEMLIKWEKGDASTVALWEKMNGWVYQGFDVTYNNLGVDFDKNYYESNTYLLGKKFVEEGLQKKVFYKKQDGSIWCDLSAEGLDEKLLLRADGTSVYMTQDIGTAIQRVKDFPDIKGMVYTVGNEQDYHFKVLFLILKKLGFQWAENLHHLSYGMVDLPSGKMKSREGTVVDADDLVLDMEETAKSISSELGKLDSFSEDQKSKLYHQIGLGALKYYILKIDTKKSILFNPKESIDFQGNTGPFVQYTYARIQSLMRHSSEIEIQKTDSSYQLNGHEKELIKKNLEFSRVIEQSASQFNPGLIANYVYDLVKSFNSFYQNNPILKSESMVVKSFRVQLSQWVGYTIKNSFELLGIEVPNQM